MAAVSEIQQTNVQLRKQLKAAKKTLKAEQDQFSALAEQSRAHGDDDAHRVQAAQWELEREKLQHMHTKAELKRIEGVLDAAYRELDQVKRLSKCSEALEECHEALTKSNQQLLQELAHVRATHKRELERMQWNFDELQQTVRQFKKLH
eukprot:m.178772 g.178772  ORF g.178772 m.178772 type:complete len:149 (+) comp14640_c1_seq11:723-1169(+)